MHWLKSTRWFLAALVLTLCVYEVPVDNVIHVDDSGKPWVDTKGFLPRASATCHGLSFTPQPFAKETITVSSTAIGFTSATYAPAGALRASVAYITIETNSIRFWSDGSTPTAAVGHPAPAGQAIEVCGVPAINQFLMIRQSADATASVTYFR